MMTFASGRERNHSKLRHSSRNLPLKLDPGQSGRSSAIDGRTTRQAFGRIKMVAGLEEDAIASDGKRLDGRFDPKLAIERPRRRSA